MLFLWGKLPWRYLSTIFGGTMLEETPEEREIFSAMEQSSVRKEIIRTTREEKISKPGVYEKSVAMPNYLHLMEELSVARMLIRELSDRLAKLESKT